MDPFLIQPNSAEEREYCDTFDIHLSRLANNATIIGMPCYKEYAATAMIRFMFFGGSYGTSPGSAHFLEHFINKKIHRDAEQNSVRLQATTSSRMLEAEMYGIAHASFREYGIWNLLSDIRKSLESPLQTVDDISSAIEAEKSVITSEIVRSENNHDYLCGRNVREVVFAQDNPLSNYPSITGTKEEVEALTEDLLIKVTRSVFNASNLLIGFYTEGDKEIARILSQELNDLFGDFPEGTRNPLNKKQMLKLHEAYKPGQTFTFSSHLKNNTITTSFIWVIKHEDSVMQFFGMSLLEELISTELFAYSRKNGWGYYTHAVSLRPTDTLTILNVRIDTKKDDRHELDEGISEVLRQSKTRIKERMELEKMRQKATYMSIPNRLSWATAGITDFGAIINADKIRQAMLSAHYDDVVDLMDSIISSSPVKVITGDLV